MSHQYSQIQLHQVLRAIYQRQAMEIANSISIDGDDLDLGHWNQTMVDVIRPVMLVIWRRGMVNGLRALLETSQGRIHVLPDRQEPNNRVHIGQGLHYLVGRDSPNSSNRIEQRISNPLVGGSTPSWENRRITYGLAGNNQGIPIVLRSASASRIHDRVGHRMVTKALNLNPNSNHIKDAVDELVLKFCRETNKTMVGEIKNTKQQIRKLIAQGLDRGHALRTLQARIGKLFTDPARVNRIVVTEVARADAAAHVMAWGESGQVKAKKWVAGIKACDRCRKLNGKIVGLDKPFTVLPEGGVYAVVYHNPLHPSCDCVCLPVLG